MTQPKPFLLTVLSGPNAGASAPLDTGRCVIGGEGDAVILAGVAPRALRLSLDGERARLEAGSEDLATGQSIDTIRTPLAAGQSRIVALPVQVRLNDETVVSLSRTAPATANLVSFRMAAVMASITLVGGLLIGLQMPAGTGTQLQARASTLPNDIPLTAKPVQTAAVPAVPAAKPESCDDSCQNRLAQSFLSQLDEAGLTGLKAVPEAGVLRVSGSLGTDQVGRWHDMRRGFEVEHGLTLPLVVNVDHADERPVLAVASVWLGALPEVRTRSGQVFRAGDVTPEGWTVTAITPGRIALSRDGQDHELRF